MIIAYDGTNYGGWQIQPNAVSVQELLQNALSSVLRSRIEVTGAGRTDAGVHALGQVAHFSFGETVSPGRLQYSLNGILPKEIRIRDLYPVPETFHARYDATGKIYRYRLTLQPIQNPFLRLYSWHIPYPINRELLQETTKLFIGTKDFTAFANESGKKNGVRTLKRLEVFDSGEETILEFEGDGFLYKMVRNITGTLLDVGRGKMLPEHIEAAFPAKDRKKAGTAAPAKGLCLVKVFYD